ncbi:MULTISPECIES: CPCC family cysteine-rich protein [unclassified Rickettsia]|uniref:CPCC family cysteine-rich protein n=1 Tax=unclassified Rickettsia TaxID=114295 RepID=UPI0031330CB9
MVSNVSGNLTALDEVDNDFIDNIYGFFGEVEIIHFTKEADSHYHFILKEVDNYEDYLRKYFKEMLQNKTIECPVCKSFSFPANDFPGSHYICAWEYDEVQFYDPDFEGGTNDTSLNQAKENFRLYNISDPSLQNWKNNNIKKTAYLNSRKWHC